MRKASFRIDELLVLRFAIVSVAKARAASMGARRRVRLGRLWAAVTDGTAALAVARTADPPAGPDGPQITDLRKATHAWLADHRTAH
jgi:hypothetical protein